MFILKSYKEMAKMPKSHIVSHLAELMKEKELSVIDVIAGTKLSEPAIRRWMKEAMMKGAIKRIDPDAVGRLCKFLDCTQEQLYTIETDED